MLKLLAYRLINQDEVTRAELEGFQAGQEVPFVPEVGLHKLKSGEFQFSSEGDFKAILSGSDFLLIKSTIAKLLTKNSPYQVKSRPAKIFRKASGEEWLDYSELDIERELKYSEYFETECSGTMVFHMLQSFVFISPELKAIMGDEVFRENGIKLSQELPLLVGQ